MTDAHKSDDQKSGSLAHASAPDAPEVVFVKSRRVACDGDGGALGHPRVYYSLDDGEAECGYCDRKFVYDPSRART